MKTGIYNIETCVGVDGKPYIMELTPRGGGNRLCEMLRYATGVDLITAITRAIVGDDPGEITQKAYDGYWAELILHAETNGVFQELIVDPSLDAQLIEEDLWVNHGDSVRGFEGANDAIGTLVLKFKTAEDLERALASQREWLKVIVK